MLLSKPTSSDIQILKKEGEKATDSAQLEASSNVAEFVASTQTTSASQLPDAFSWSFYYDEGSHKSNKNNQRSNMVKLGTFGSVEAFWGYFNTLDKSLDRICKSGKFNLRLFKGAIQPYWQDTANVNGGKWVIGCRMESIERVREMWNELILATIGSQLPLAAHLCGVALAQRDGQRELQIWVDSDPFAGSTDTDSTVNEPVQSEAVQQSITKALRNALRLPNHIDLRYHSHQSLMSRRLDMKRDNKRIVKVSHKQIKAQTWPDQPEQGESKTMTRDVESLDVHLNIGSDGKQQPLPASSSTPVTVSSSATPVTASSSATPVTASSTPVTVSSSAPSVTEEAQTHALAPAPLDEEIESSGDETTTATTSESGKTERREARGARMTVTDVVAPSASSSSSSSTSSSVSAPTTTITTTAATGTSATTSYVADRMAPIIAEMQQLQIQTTRNNNNNNATPNVLPPQNNPYNNLPSSSFNNNNSHYPNSYNNNNYNNGYNNNNFNNYHAYDVYDRRGSGRMAHRRHSHDSDDSDDSDEGTSSISARQYLAAQGHPSPGALVKALLATVGDGSPAALAAAAAALIPDTIPRALARSMRKKARRKLNRLKRKRLMQLQQMAKDGLIPQSAIPATVQAVSLTRPITASHIRAAATTSSSASTVSYSAPQQQSNSLSSSVYPSPQSVYPSQSQSQSAAASELSPTSPLLVTQQQLLSEFNALASLPQHQQQLQQQPLAFPVHPTTVTTLPLVYPSTFAGQMGYFDPTHSAAAVSSPQQQQQPSQQQQTASTAPAATATTTSSASSTSPVCASTTAPTMMAMPTQEYIVIPEQQFTTLYNCGVDMYGYQYMYDPYSQQMVYMAPLQSLPVLPQQATQAQATQQPVLMTTADNNAYAAVLRPIPYVAYHTPESSVTSSRRSSASVHPDRMTAAPYTASSHGHSSHNRELLRARKTDQYPQQIPLLQPTSSLQHMTPAQALVALTPSHPSQLLQATAHSSSIAVATSSSSSQSASGDADKYQRQYNKMQEKRKQYQSYDNVKDTSTGCFIPHPDMQSQ